MPLYVCTTPQVRTADIGRRASRIPILCTRCNQHAKLALSPGKFSPVQFDRSLVEYHSLSELSVTKNRNPVGWDVLK